MLGSAIFLTTLAFNKTAFKVVETYLQSVSSNFNIYTQAAMVFELMVEYLEYITWLVTRQNFLNYL